MRMLKNLFYKAISTAPPPRILFKKYNINRFLLNSSLRQTRVELQRVEGLKIKYSVCSLAILVIITVIYNY